MNRAARRGFSLVEMLVALTITGTLLTATLVALDSAFKGYKATTEGASTHVVTRIVMDRVASMIRTGTEFGPYPDDPLDTTQNPVTSSSIEFVAWEDADLGQRRIVTIDARTSRDLRTGPKVLWYTESLMEGDKEISAFSTPLLTNVQEALFTLEYDVGPRLLRATLDITVEPNDVQDAAVKADIGAPALRLVTTVAPRRLDEE